MVSLGRICLVTAVMLASATTRADEAINYDASIGVIEATLPKGWSIAETHADVLPEGHYSGMRYHGRKGLEVVAQGPRDVALHWKDSAEKWHQEPVAKEALRIWLMPPSYEQSWKRFFVMKSPKTADLLFAGPTFKVYGTPSFRIVAPDKTRELVRSARSTGWPDSPGHTGSLSWATWEDDLQRVFRTNDKRMP